MLRARQLQQVLCQASQGLNRFYSAHCLSLWAANLRRSRQAKGRIALRQGIPPGTKAAASRVRYLLIGAAVLRQTASDLSGEDPRPTGGLSTPGTTGERRMAAQGRRHASAMWPGTGRCDCPRGGGVMADNDE